MIHSVHTPSHKILYIVKIFCVDIGSPRSPGKIHLVRNWFKSTLFLPIVKSHPVLECLF